MTEFENIPQIKPNIDKSFLDDQNKIEESIPNLKNESVEMSVSDSGSKKYPDIKNLKPKSSRKFKKLFKILLSVGGILIVLGIALTLLTFNIYRKGMALKIAGESLMAAGREQDLVKIKSEIVKTKEKLNEFDRAYRLIGWAKIIPYFGSFVSDGQHFIAAGKQSFEAAEIMIDAIDPYADIIGLKGGKAAASPDETTQDRIDFVIKSIPEIIPELDKLTAKVEIIKKELDDVDPSKYPQEIKGKEVRSQLEKGLGLVDELAEMLITSKPLLERSSYLLGVDKPRNYLVIFQNDKELRPTGGFITAYSIAKVQKGKFEPVISSDIYNLDSAYTPSVTAPEPIVKYLQGPYIASKKLRLRDMNWSPDFSESMELFTKEAEKAGIKNIDGVIAVDTQMLVNLLEVIGEIGVSGYGNFSNKIIPECNCPQVIYELESFADIEGPIVWSENEPGKVVYAPPNYDNRKKIIGPLMNSVLSNTLGQPKEKLPSLFEAGIKSLMEKHVLFYFFDEDSQNAVSTFGIAGTLEGYGGDYLHINDANLGGRKSNLYVQQEVSQEIKILKDQTIEKTLTLTYKNPEKHDGWLNSVLPNWVRIYVPEGSELISMDGFEDKSEPYKDLGKTVFAGFFQLRPQGVSKLVVKYKIPIKVESKTYKIMIQKQPGTGNPLYIVNLGKVQEEFFLNTDKELKLKVKGI